MREDAGIEVIVADIGIGSLDCEALDHHVAEVRSPNIQSLPRALVGAEKMTVRSTSCASSSMTATVYGVTMSVTKAIRRRDAPAGRNPSARPPEPAGLRGEAGSGRSIVHLDAPAYRLRPQSVSGDLAFVHPARGSSPARAGNRHRHILDSPQRSEHIFSPSMIERSIAAPTHCVRSGRARSSPPTCARFGTGLTLTCAHCSGRCGEAGGAHASSRGSCSTFSRRCRSGSRSSVRGSDTFTRTSPIRPRTSR